MEQQCEHEYKILDINYTRREGGYRAHYFKRTTTYYCTKCLNEEIKIKEEHSQEWPDWWKKSEST